MAVRSEMTVSQIALDLDRDRRFIERCIENAKVKPVREKGTAKYYHLNEVVGAMYESQALNLNNEKALLARSQREKNEMEVSRLKGELIPKEEVEREASSVATRIKAQLTAIPARLSGVLASIDDPTEVEQKLEAEMRQVLEELSK